MAAQPPDQTTPGIGAQCLQCSDRWLELYAEHNGGRKYIWIGSSHSPHNTRLVKAYGPEEVMLRMERYFRDEYHRARPSFIKFVNAWNELIDTQQPSTPVQKNLESLARAAEAQGSERATQIAGALAPLFAMPWYVDRGDEVKRVYIAALQGNDPALLARAVGHLIRDWQPSRFEQFPAPATIKRFVRERQYAEWLRAPPQLPAPRPKLPEGFSPLKLFRDVVAQRQALTAGAERF